MTSKKKPEDRCNGTRVPNVKHQLQTKFHPKSPRSQAQRDCKRCTEGAA